MSRLLLAEEAADDLDRIADFLLHNDPAAAAATVDLILNGLEILTDHPLVGRPLAAGLRELVISRGRTGYLALYRFDAQSDIALVLAVRHQRESAYH